MKGLEGHSVFPTPFFQQDQHRLLIAQRGKPTPEIRPYFSHFRLQNHRMETSAEFGSARHGIETYKYRLCNQFDQIGLPKQFQDCAYILK